MPSDIIFTPQGPVAPETAEVRAAVTRYWQAAFDNLLNPDMATPQGQLITSETAAIQDKNNQLLHLAQQFDPANAEGRFQDALAAIYFIERQPARSTVVMCECTGLAGVTIPGADTSTEPALVRDDAGNEFFCQSTTVIPASGTVLVPFAAQEAGPVEVEANAVTTIVTVIAGWDTVNNPEAGATGQNEEGRRAFELRRHDSVALNSRSMLASVYAEVANSDGVIDVLARQNRGDTPKTEGGITMGPHSIYISAVGGQDADIARAIYNSVSGGCDYNGNTAVKHTDPVTGAVETVLFERPAELPFTITVRLRANAATPSTIAQLVRENILADFYGEPYPHNTGAAHQGAGGRVHIGDTVYASRFYCPALAAGATDLLSVVISAGGGNAGNVVEIPYDRFPSLVAAAIDVVVEGA